MNEQEKQLSDKILDEALRANGDDGIAIGSPRYNLLIQYSLLVSASKSRAEAEQIEVETFSMLQDLDVCEDCGELI